MLAGLLGWQAQAADVVGAEVSPRRAFWSSLLIPGWGQRAAGADQSALRFFAVDLGLWAGYLGMQRLSDIRREHYLTYAADHAGARPTGKDRRYFDDLGFYDSRLEHNQFARREEGAEADLYPAGSAFDWQWDDQSSRRRYRSLRNDSERAHRQALFATGLVVINHLAAAIHAARTARRLQSADAPVGEQIDEHHLALELASPPDGIGIRLRRQF